MLLPMLFPKDDLSISTNFDHTLSPSSSGNPWRSLWFAFCFIFATKVGLSTDLERDVHLSWFVPLHNLEPESGASQSQIMPKQSGFCELLASVDLASHDSNNLRFGSTIGVMKPLSSYSAGTNMMLICCLPTKQHKVLYLYFIGTATSSVLSLGWKHLFQHLVRWCSMHSAVSIRQDLRTEVRQRHRTGPYSWLLWQLVLRLARDSYESSHKTCWPGLMDAIDLARIHHDSSMAFTASCWDMCML